MLAGCAEIYGLHKTLLLHFYTKTEQFFYRQPSVTGSSSDESAILPETFKRRDTFRVHYQFQQSATL